MAANPAITVVVVAYDMARELPRTLYSLSSQYQQGIDTDDIEVIVVDNGSPHPIDPAALRVIQGPLHSLRVENAPASPARAANRGIEMASGDLVGLLIDGARISSPGLLSTARQAAWLSDRPIVATLGWHLGNHVHMEAAEHGYDQAREDELLESADWTEDGYRLFRISTLAASSRRGYFGPLGESNAMFLPRSMWSELGGLDEAFALPGGGLVNHDLYRRACLLDGSDLVVLLGEGTFHQYHGGAFTSGQGDRRAAREEYKKLRGAGFTPLVRDTSYFGRLHEPALDSLEHSLQWARTEHGPSGSN